MLLVHYRFSSSYRPCTLIITLTVSRPPEFVFHDIPLLYHITITHTSSGFQWIWKHQFFLPRAGSILIASTFPWVSIMPWRLALMPFPNGEEQTWSHLWVRKVAFLMQPPGVLVERWGNTRSWLYSELGLHGANIAAKKSQRLKFLFYIFR